MSGRDKHPVASSVEAARLDRRSDSWWKRRRVGFLASLATFIVHALGLTWRVRYEGGEEWAALRAEGKPVILAVWHGELLPLVWGHRNEPISILVSTHADGEIITRVLMSLGFDTVRGSSSRGGARALLEMVRLLRDGRDLAITPDGPRGPRRVFAAGAAVAAMRAGAPVVGVGALVNSAWQLRSWDRLVIPKPFARVTIRYAPPTYVEASSSKEAEEMAPMLATRINSVAMPDVA